MALSSIGVLDLSIITDRLISLLKDSYDHSPLWSENGGDIAKFNIAITGTAPEAVRDQGGCQLSLYLFHVAQDKFQVNGTVNGPRAQRVPFQPLSLTLHYLLSAFAKGDYAEEQQAMSIALRCLHEHPIVRADVKLNLPPVTTVSEEFTLTMDVEAADEMSRLWQSVASPMRLAAVYRVGAVFATPPAPPAPSGKVQAVTLVADATSVPFSHGALVTGTFRRVVFASPRSSVAHPEISSFDSAPATAAPGQALRLNGAKLDQPTAKRVYLVAPDGTEREITSWIIPIIDHGPPPAAIKSPSKITLRLPATLGTPPAGAPAPGVYQLRVGSDITKGDAQTYRSNATPFSVAARIDVATVPPNAPLLAGPPFTLAGEGFQAGATKVLLDTVALGEAAGAPAAGEFNVAGSTAITLAPPAGLPHGLYTVRVRVNDVESDPSWWISL